MTRDFDGLHSSRARRNRESRADSGERLYRARVGGGGAFAASPVAADGRLYFTSEDGDTFVVKAGSEYEELGKYSFNEAVMATPAISDGVIVIRTLKHVYGIGEPGARPASPGSLTQKKK